MLIKTTMANQWLSQEVKNILGIALCFCYSARNYARHKIFSKNLIVNGKEKIQQMYVFPANQVWENVFLVFLTNFAV